MANKPSDFAIALWLAINRAEQSGFMTFAATLRVLLEKQIQRETYS